MRVPVRVLVPTADRKCAAALVTSTELLSFSASSPFKLSSNNPSLGALCAEFRGHQIWIEAIICWHFLMEAIWLEWKEEGWDTTEDNGPCEDHIEGGGRRLQQGENKENLQNLNMERGLKRLKQNLQIPPDFTDKNHVEYWFWLGSWLLSVNLVRSTRLMKVTFDCVSWIHHHPSNLQANFDFICVL